MDQPFDRIAESYDFTNDLISLGLHRFWKRKLISRFRNAQVSTTARVLDVATGTGELGDRLKSAIPTLEVIGIDPSLAMLEQGRKMGRKMDQWVLGRAESLPMENETFDAITCAYGVRNFCNRDQAIREWRRVLKPGGQVFVLEIHEARRPLLRQMWRKLMPLIASVSTHQKNYDYLAHSTVQFPSADELVLEVESHGFTRLSAEELGVSGMLSLLVFRKA